jgi:hypothetical protein
MRINKLRGTIADRAIDSQVAQDESETNSTMNRINAIQPRVEHVDVSRLPQYEKG